MPLLNKPINLQMQETVLSYSRKASCAELGSRILGTPLTIEGDMVSSRGRSSPVDNRGQSRELLPRSYSPVQCGVWEYAIISEYKSYISHHISPW